MKGGGGGGGRGGGLRIWVWNNKFQWVGYRQRGVYGPSADGWMTVLCKVPPVVALAHYADDDYDSKQ